MLQALPVLFLASIVAILFQLVYEPKEKKKDTQAQKLGKAIAEYLDKKVPDKKNGG